MTPIDIASLPAIDADVVYAVGDLHGRLDLLNAMEIAIAADVAKTKPARPVICYLGDYVDRGPHSAQVIDRLSGPFQEGVARVFLKGNHEDRMLDFFDAPAENGPSWMAFGGREALESYGMAVADPSPDGWGAFALEVLAKVPARHVAFLQNLQLGVRWGDYLFVHAGLNPELPLSAQVTRDLMWIREPFLSSDAQWGVRVVHGHVIVDEPVFRTSRIGIDTGAYRSGLLTCLVVRTAGLSILQSRIVQA